MKRCLALVLLGFFYFSVNAQFFDDFEDGDFTQGHIWTGDTSRYKVNTDKQLQLNSSGESVSFLSTSLGASDVSEWNIWVKCSFSPSDNNQALIYLLSDQQDLLQPLNGFFLKLGESGSGDAIELYRQSPVGKTLIARGSDGYVNSAFDIRIKVIRDNGKWEIWADSTGGSSFAKQATGTDNYWQTFSYLGVVCKYTSSNATKFRFDEIYAGPFLIDNEPPILEQAIIENQSSIALSFNENISLASAEKVQNYYINNDTGNPVSAIRDNNDHSNINLTFNHPFEDGIDYELSVSGLTDEAGNMIRDTTVELSFNTVKQFDIVINEIMADPDPPVQLPDCEYLELFNRTEHDISMDGWKLVIGKSVKQLPSFIMQPHSFVILTNGSCDSLFLTYGKVVSFPGFSLLNTGTSLTLKDDKNRVIHYVVYDPKWIDNSQKEEGGWSLEQVDDFNPCGRSDNWKVTKDASGGTPGKLNSVAESNQDISKPSITGLSVKDTLTVCVYFTEPIDSLQVLNRYNYQVDNGIGIPDTVFSTTPGYDCVTLVMSQPIKRDTVYTLTINETLCDCVGNSFFDTYTIKFGLPYAVDSNDLIINEVLFDPWTTGTDFAEVYNRSEHILSLEGILFGIRYQTNGDIENLCSCNYGKLILPGEYIALTKEPELLQADYFTPCPDGINKAEGFPELSNNGGEILLTNAQGLVIDEMHYDEDMHFPLLNSTKGVSLERIDFNRPSGDKNNWHSASGNAGFATPAYKNSQFMQNDGTQSKITIEPTVFSPDNDGNNDILSIHCQMTKPGALITIRIYDYDGRLVRLLTGNNYAGEKATFFWDGTNESNEVARSGIYVVFVEVVDTGGEVERFKEAVVVTGY